MIVIGVDVGGTKILGGVFDDGRELDRLQIATPPSADGRGDPGGDATVDVVKRLSSGRTISAVCVAVPEYVDDGRITSEEVLDWPQSTVASIVDRIADQVEGPLRWESDVRCGAIGEWHAAADAGFDGRSLLHISLGTGISHTLVVDGVPYPGERGEAIALGELRTRAAGLRVEGFCSGRAMLSRWAETHGPIDPADLFSPADGSAAAAFLSEPAEMLGWAIAQASLLLDPGRVVLGGGLGSRDTEYRRLIIDAAARFSSRRPVVLHPSAAGGDAGLIGASHIATQIARSA